MGLSVGAVIIASMRSIGTALTMAACGAYLSRRGVLTAPVTKALAKVSMQLTMPCLLFTSILNCTQDWSTDPCPDIKQSIKEGWPLLFLPLVNVGIGAMLGKLIVEIRGPPPNFRSAIIAACAFGNSTGLPVTLLAVIHMSFPPTAKLGATNPILFLSVYLLLYPVLQWGFGTWLVGGEEDPAPSDNPPERSPIELTVLNQTGADGLALKHPLFTPRSEPGPSLHTGIAAGVRKFCEIFCKPAVIAVLAGILVSLTPAQDILVDRIDRDDDKPLEWMFDGILNVGRAAVPINMMILGSKISKGAKLSAVDWKSNLAVVVAKMIVMPIVGIATALFLHAVTNMDPAQAPSFYLGKHFVFANERDAASLGA